jgi:hypothetical protein
MALLEKDSPNTIVGSISFYGKSGIDSIGAELIACFSVSKAI